MASPISQPSGAVLGRKTSSKPKRNAAAAPTQLAALDELEPQPLAKKAKLVKVWLARAPSSSALSL
jgi:hypothetical protein